MSNDIIINADLLALDFKRVAKEAVDKYKEAIRRDFEERIDLLSGEIDYLVDVNGWDSIAQETPNRYANALIGAHQKEINFLSGLIEKML